MLNNNKNIILIISVLLVLLGISFVIVKPKIEKINEMQVEIINKKIELESIKDKLIELDLKNWDKQITKKLDDHLNLGKMVVENNINKNNINKDNSMKFAYGLIEDSLYIKNLKWTFFARNDGFYSSVKLIPNKTILISDETNKIIQAYKYNINSQIFEYDYDMSGYNPIERNLYTNITKSNREKWLNPYEDIDGNSIMTFTKGIFDENNEKLGVWGLELMFSDIQLYLTKIKPTLNTEVSVIFYPNIDEDNNIIRYTDYIYDNYNWTIQWIIPKDEFENYGSDILSLLKEVSDFSFE